MSFAAEYEAAQTPGAGEETFRAQGHAVMHLPIERVV